MSMKKSVLFLSYIVSSILFLSTFSSSVFAQENATSNPPTSSTKNQQQAFTLDLKIENPLKVTTVQEAIKLGLDFVMKIAIPVIIVLFIWSGFLFVFALGNKEKLTKAKNNFLYTLIGSGIVLGAWTIATAIINTVNSLAQ